MRVRGLRRSQRVRATADLQLDFQQRKRHEYREKQALRDLPAAQLACETLDVEQGLGLSDLWFRPPPEPVSDEDGNPIVPVPEGGATATTEGDTEGEAFGTEPGGFATLEASEQLIIVTRCVKARSSLVTHPFQIAWLIAAPLHHPVGSAAM